jgi:hypothetical protein
MHTIVLKCCLELFLTDVWMASHLTLLYRFSYLSLVKFDLHYCDLISKVKPFQG